MAENSTTAWLYSFLRPMRQTFNEVVALSVFINVLALALPIVTLQIYDRVISHNGISTLQGLVVGTIIVVLFDFVLRQGRSRILQNVALRADVYVSRELFTKFMSLPLKTLENQPSAYWLSLFNDVDVIRYTLSGKSVTFIADLPFIFLYLIMIFVIATPIAWVFLLILPVLIFFAWRASTAVALANSEEQKTAQTRSMLVLEMINARNTIKAMSLETIMGPLWEDVQAKNIESSVNQSTKLEHFSNISVFLIMTAFIFVLTVGALSIISQELTVGTLVATFMLSSLLFDPLIQYARNLRTYYSFFQSVDRLGELFSSVSERQGNSIISKKPVGKITLENISFSHSNELPEVINNIDYDFKATEIHALVGSNGSGKSTLLRLILGLYEPTGGRILIDGVDISQFSRTELSTWIGYVPQDYMLFSGTVRDNISCRQPNISDDEVVRVAKVAGLHQFIVNMQDGYSTEIGEAGLRLSSGERQRIAIARALVGDPPILLLDEPSSTLDHQAELELRQTLTSIGKQSTIIIVTHSPTLLACSTNIVALDKGRINVAGTSISDFPWLFSIDAKLSHTAPSQFVEVEEQKGKRIGTKHEISQAQTQTKFSKKQKKLIAVRAVKSSPASAPVISQTIDQKQAKQPNINKNSTNTPKSPDKRDNKL